MAFDPATRMWTSFLFIVSHFINAAFLIFTIKGSVPSHHRSNTGWTWRFFPIVICYSGSLTSTRYDSNKPLYLTTSLGGWHGTGDRNSVEVVILAIVVIIGLVKAFISLYGFVNKQTERFLGKMENMVLEVQ